MKKFKRVKLTVYFPLSRSEKEHIESLIEILQLRRIGDYQLVAEITNMNVGTVVKSLIRPDSKKHMVAYKALKEIISNRRELIENKKV
jgi:hypothetical protein